VVDRAQEGGHYVDPITVADNFYGNLEKLNLHYGMFHMVQIIDTSETEHRVLAVLNEGEPILFVSYAELPEWFMVNLPAIAHKIELLDADISS
jgi:hypothetical protein